MNLFRPLLVWLCFPISVCLFGCRDRSSMELEGGGAFLEVAGRISKPQPGTLAYGFRVIGAILGQENEQQRSESMSNFARSMFNAQFDAQDYAERLRQIDAFNDLARAYDGGFGAKEDKVKERLMANIAIIDRLRQERSRVEKESDEERKLKPGVHVGKKHYVTAVNIHIGDWQERAKRLLRTMDMTTLSEECRNRLEADISR